MKNIKLKIGSLALGNALSKFGNETMRENIEYDRLINEIAAIADVSPEEVKEFYEAHGFPISYIKQTVLLGSKLDANDMRRVVAEEIARKAKPLTDLLPPHTWRDTLSDIPFYFAYYLSYPFFWLVFWLWQGIMQAREEIWIEDEC